MAVNYIYPEYEVARNYDRCINCKVCENQCANEAHEYLADMDKMISDHAKCVNCQDRKSVV